MSFVVTKLVRLFTMKNTKSLKVNHHCLGYGDRSPTFFMPFMVDSLVWRLPMLRGWECPISLFGLQ